MTAKILQFPTNFKRKQEVDNSDGVGGLSLDEIDRMLFEINKEAEELIGLYTEDSSYTEMTDADFWTLLDEIDDE